MKKACLVLQDGSVFEGFRFGASRDAVCEVVFNTGLTGYLELLTDASYAGQAIVMAAPIMGNYGIFEEESESYRPWVEAMIVRDLTEIENDKRQAEDLAAYLKRNDIPGLYGVDTRALTLLLRESGTMTGVIVDGAPDELDLNVCKERIASYDAKRVVPMVSYPEKRFFPAYVATWDKESFVRRAQKGEPSRAEQEKDKKAGKASYKLALIDFGVKQKIVWNLTRRGCDVTTYPWDTKANDILADRPDGVVLSNGPGNPKHCQKAIDEIKILFDKKIPMMGICLGHQLIALASGADTHKLRYGHRGTNHPVKDLFTGRVYISSQNHGYVVSDDTIDQSACKVTHINMNDDTNEGLAYNDRPIFSVQYHPEGSPGSQDNNYLFDDFIKSLRRA